MTTEYPYGEDHLDFRYNCYKGAVFGGGYNAVRWDCDKMMNSRTEFCLGACSVALPQHVILFRTEFVGDTTIDWEQVTVESSDSGNALIRSQNDTCLDFVRSLSVACRLSSGLRAHRRSL